MVLARKTTLAAVCAVALALLAGCGNKAEVNNEGQAGAHSQPGTEGLAVTLSGLEYTVYITRELNLKIPPDSDFYRGPEAPPGQTLYGVFIQVCNRHNPAKRSASTFKVTDNQGNEFQPTPAGANNPFAYSPRTLAKDECIPQAGSPAQLGPAAASMILFKLPLTNTENRPLVFDIQSPTGQSKSVQLDL
jgi:hypothetical protein